MSTVQTIPLRFVTAASLFDGHDASINIIRRLLQKSGNEVIHLGHNRSVPDIVRAALQEDADAIAISSYQGGHNEFFRFLRSELDKRGLQHIAIFGGGGGVIIPDEIKALEDDGIDKIYSPDDGRELGLQGIIDDMNKRAHARQEQRNKVNEQKPTCVAENFSLAVELSNVENGMSEVSGSDSNNLPPVLGITGTGGAGKSSLTDELIRRFIASSPDLKIALLAVDPSKRQTGGALLGDRIRMNAVYGDRCFMRSFGTRGAQGELSKALSDCLPLVRSAGFDLVIVETSGIGQGDSAVTDISDLSVYVMTSEFGAATQLEKIDMIDYANAVVVNKFDRTGSEDALRDVKKQWRRSRNGFEIEDQDLPIFGTIASRFNDDGINALFNWLNNALFNAEQNKMSKTTSGQAAIIPAGKINYLGDIASLVKAYKQQVYLDAELLRKHAALQAVQEQLPENSEISQQLAGYDVDSLLLELQEWDDLIGSYSKDEVVVKVRTRELSFDTATTSLSGTRIPRVAFPAFTDPGDRLIYSRLESAPGRFPFTAGVFPFKRTDEEPKRQFAGEGSPARTNRRFHYLSKDDDAKRLSTAYDSLTLYGEDPEERPDIFGKIGEGGVSICTIDDVRTLYDGFDLCHPNTSVSMTINGPAPIMLAMYFNVAIDQQLQKKQDELGRELNKDEIAEVRKQTLSNIRGTVQADILKEDQAQNTCIFSTEFAMKLMGDVQQYFIDREVRNYYSVSISGYHIAEAGANPISQLAFTLANGFTYVEYYLSRGMDINDFAPNLSFFFSNGLDPEYTVIGRVARRIWSVAMRDKYGANQRSQKLKYHIQTSGRSLHAQEIDFNDIRTTLQALMAIYDNCNSLHTNSYDEAITTPSEESVRRAMAIQMIINRELGWAKNQNPLQGSAFIDEMTELVEEAVLVEFENISRRGGVPGAMETQYQRGKIQEESLLYEHKKHSGELPIIGVNTYLSTNTAQADSNDIHLARCDNQEKSQRLIDLAEFKSNHSDKSSESLIALRNAVLKGENVFVELMNTVRHCSMGEITNTLYEVGGQYRRSM
jgi:methylmalonyl-CoA mutase